jgi:hypothetical protein
MGIQIVEKQQPLIVIPLIEIQRPRGQPPVFVQAAYPPREIAARELSGQGPYEPRKAITRNESREGRTPGPGKARGRGAAYADYDVDKIGPTAANQLVTIQEGKGLVSAKPPPAAR